MSRDGRVRVLQTGDGTCAVYLVGGGPICKAGLRSLIESQSEFSVAPRVTAADVIVIDLDTSGAIPLVASCMPRVPISGNPRKIDSGAIPRNADPESLFGAIRAAYSMSTGGGKAPLNYRGGGGSNDDSALLSPRQSEVAVLIANGLRYREVADRLRISPHTVKNHAKIIFEKLNVHSRVQLAVYWRKHRLRAPMLRSTGSIDP